MPKGVNILVLVSLTAFCGVLILLATTNTIRGQDETTIDACVGACPTATPSVTPTSAPTATPTSEPGETATPTPSATATATSAATSPTPTGSGIPEPSATPKPPFAPKGLIIYGYTASDSITYLSGIGVSEVTKSEVSGYFKFDRLTFPTILSYAADQLFPELCIQTVDDNKLVSQPSCIPAMPLSMSISEVGPILVSPTISIDKNIYYQDEFVKSYGKTLPNSKIKISLIKQNKSFIPQIISIVSAYSLPIYEVISDSSGYYSFNLPSNTLDNWKIFSSTEYQNSLSPTSNILHFSVKPQIYHATEIYEDISQYIISDVYIAIAVIEIFLILALVILYLKRFKKGTLSATFKVKVTKKKTHSTLSQLQKEYMRLQSEYLSILRKKGLI